MRQYRGLLRGQGTSIVDLYWAGCIINMSGFDLRQAQGSVDVRFGADCVAKVFLSHRSQIFRAVGAAIEY